LACKARSFAPAGGSSSRNLRLVRGESSASAPAAGAVLSCSALTLLLRRLGFSRRARFRTATDLDSRPSPRSSSWGILPRFARIQTLYVLPRGFLAPRRVWRSSSPGAARLFQKQRRCASDSASCKQSSSVSCSPRLSPKARRAVRSRF
jgi:hypothetical protein